MSSVRVLVGTRKGAFVITADGARKNWDIQGLRSSHIPDGTAEIGHCVHHVAQHRARPNVLFMQKHWDVMRSDDAGDNWVEVSGNLPTDFGFPIDIHAHEPDTIYVVPIKRDSEHYPPDGKLRVYRSRIGGQVYASPGGGDTWAAISRDLPPVLSVEVQTLTD